MSEQVVREVRVIANSTNERLVTETDATTFGELKEDSVVGEHLSNDVKVIIRENKTSLDVDDAELPSGSFTLFALAKKSKSGSDRYDEMGYIDLKRECAERESIDPSSYNGKGHTMESMRQALRENDRASASVEDTGSQEQPDDVSDRVLELSNRVQAAIDEHQTRLKEDVDTIISEYEGVTVDTFFSRFNYEEEINNLRAQLPEVE